VGRYKSFGSPRSCVFHSAELSAIRKKARSTNPQQRATAPYQRLDIDIITNPSTRSLTPRTYFPYYLLVVDNYSRLPTLMGISTDTSPTAMNVIDCLMRYIGAHMRDVKEIRSDAGCQFSAADFNAWCSVLSITSTRAAPRHQEQNGIAERTWQSIRTLAYAMMMHARVDHPYCHHALLHACYIFSILPVRGLQDADQNPTTPYYLFHGTLPQISPLRTLFCPVVYKTNQKGMQQGVRGVHIGYPENQAGYKIFVPSTRQIVVSADVIFDEEFRSAVGLTNRIFHNSIYLRPFEHVEATEGQEVETTGDIRNVIDLTEYSDDEDAAIDEDEVQIVNKENNKKNETESEATPHFDPVTNNFESNDSPETYHEQEDEPQIRIEEEEENLSQEEEESVSQEILETTKEEEIEEEKPQESPSPPPKTSDSTTNLQRSGRIRNQQDYNKLHHGKFVRAYHTTTKKTETLQLLDDVTSEAMNLPKLGEPGSEVSVFRPEPRNMHEMLRLPTDIREQWLKADRAELKNLIDNKTVQIENPKLGEKVYPTLSLYKVKLNSKGLLDKLKSRIVVRGDLMRQDLPHGDPYSPTASSRTLKMFLADAAKHQVRVKQLDFIGAFLQAKMKYRMFVMLPQKYGQLFPEYASWCGRPLSQCTAQLIQERCGMRSCMIS